MEPGPAAGLPRADLERRVAELQAEVAALRATRRQAGADHFFDIIETSPIGIVVHRGGRPLYANPAMAAMVGVSRDAYMASVDALDWVCQADRAIVADYARRFLAGEPLPPGGSFRLVRADGTEFWVEVHTTRVDWEGSPAVVSALTDITDRHAAERDLRQSRTLFQAIFNATPDVVTVTDMDSGRFVDVNRAFLEHSRHSRDELIGARPDDVGIYGDRGFRAELLRRVAGEGAVREVEAAAETAKGSRMFTLSAEALRIGQRRLMLAIGRDVTDWRRQQDELRRSKQSAERANRAKSEFLASMSHELRTPLNAIIGFSEVIRDAVFGPIDVPRYTEYAKDINDSGQHLLQIINDLLDLTKLEAGKLELHEAEVRAPEVIQSCLRLVKARAEDNGVVVTPALPPGLPAVRGDARLLKQIVINLLSNAVKFTPRGGRIEAGARRGAGGGLEFYVADSGIGMSAAEIEVALTPFGQVDGVLSRKHQGTGLGLPLARSLAELHGGRLAIDSRPGAGTTVTVRLPAERVVDAPPPGRRRGRAFG